MKSNQSVGKTAGKRGKDTKTEAVCVSVCLLPPLVSGGLDLPLNRDFESAKGAQTGFRTGSFYFGHFTNVCKICLVK